MCCFHVCHDVLMRGCEAVLLILPLLALCLSLTVLAIIPQPESDEREGGEGGIAPCGSVHIIVDRYIHPANKADGP